MDNDVPFSGPAFGPRRGVAHSQGKAPIRSSRCFRTGVAALFVLLLGACTDGGQGPSVRSTTPDPAADAPPYSPASPGTFIVNSTDDDVDAMPGDGACATAAGACTLRAAVQESNATILFSTNAFTRTNVILLPAGHYRFTNPPIAPAVVAEGTSSAGQLSILGSTNIRGAGARKTIIDGNQLDRVFGVAPNAVLSISDVTITGGARGGIFNQGQLTVTRVTVTGNQASYGGGIFNTPLSSAIIESSTISNNVATSEAGGIRFDAAGLVINSTISGNRVLSTCCADDEHDGSSAGEGGGIDARSGGPVTIINSTIVNNHAVTGGGGVNVATSYQGDPVGTFDALGTEVLGRPIELINTIVAGNTSDRGPRNCKNTVAGIHSLGGNIADDDSCPLDAAHDLPSTNPGLGTLANNGGFTDTHALLPGTPAFSNGVASGCPSLDQRGTSRREPCDSGAFETAPF